MINIFPLIVGQKVKNIELIKNYSKWFGLNYEIVYFFNVYGEDHNNMEKCQLL